MELRSILQIVGETTRKPSTAIVCRLCHLYRCAQRLESSLYSTVAATKPLRLKKNLVATPGSEIQFDQPRGKGAERHFTHDSKKVHLYWLQLVAQNCFVRRSPGL